jgi:1,4-alpha-glucan branching enzyme
VTSIPLEAVAALTDGSHGAPFDVLGIHPLSKASKSGRIVRVFLPWASTIGIVRAGTRTAMERVGDSALFEATFPRAKTFFAYELDVEDADGRHWPVQDPYRLKPALDERRVRSFLVGEERRAHEVLGAIRMRHEGLEGTLFAVWAPHARAVGVSGDMNGWDGRCHPMRPRGATGVWELFIPGVEKGARYKYTLLDAHGQHVEKADPFGRAVELRPATASEVWDGDGYSWGDGAWMRGRADWDVQRSPMSVYEVHLGSWRRHPDRAPAAGVPGWLGYRELADELVPYVAEMGFTHIELLPVLEHPLDQSWGYQPLGFFAPTSRFGSPDDFRYLVDRAHQAGLGVILDWVPGHFPEDRHGLVRFDGTELYEHADPRQARHPDWGTLTFDFARPAVRSFLVSSALHWLEDYHLDGLRVDAVASMLYLDYSRQPGQWVPNREGGRENLDAVAFLRELNDIVHEACPGALTIAEESTAWPGVSRSTDEGGLGFDQKWNMGWMNDTLSVFGRDPIHRKHHYNELTFSIFYAFEERFVLPLSHDEVVHEKRSLVSKMPGPNEDKLANLRTLYAYLWSHPGKKLLFMGGEMAQWHEWDVDDQLDWALLDHHLHAGMRLLVGDLNRVYREHEALHAQDFSAEGFEWLDCSDPDRVLLSFMRWAPGWRDPVLVAINMTPVPRSDFVLPVPHAGRYRVLLNSDAPVYGGSGLPVPSELQTRRERLHGRDHVLDVPLPGLSALYLTRSS